MTKEVPLFRLEDKPYLDLIDLADDASIVSSQPETVDGVSNFAPWRKDFSKLVGRVKYRTINIAQRLAPAAVKHSMRSSDAADHTYPQRDHPVEIFLDTNTTGDEARVIDFIREVQSLSKDEKATVKVSYISLFLGNLTVSAISSAVKEASVYGIQLIGKGVTSEMPYEDFKIKNNGLELLDGAVTCFEQAQEAGIRHGMVAFDVAQALRESGKIDPSFSLTCTGIALDTTQETRHRVLETAGNALVYANRLLVGSEVTHSRFPLDMLGAYVENMKVSHNLLRTT